MTKEQLRLGRRGCLFFRRNSDLHFDPHTCKIFVKITRFCLQESKRKNRSNPLFKRFTYGRGDAI